MTTSIVSPAAPAPGIHVTNLAEAAEAATSWPDVVTFALAVILMLGMAWIINRD